MGGLVPQPAASFKYLYFGNVAFESAPPAAIHMRIVYGILYVFTLWLFLFFLFHLNHTILYIVFLFFIADMCLS